jgi:hypothetical protein
MTINAFKVHARKDIRHIVGRACRAEKRLGSFALLLTAAALAKSDE